MKFLVVGCGSIGKRHAANAAKLGATAVYDANRLAADAAAAGGGIEVFSDLAAALAWKPDGVIVATPHTSHIAVAAQAIEVGAHVLIEKPISHDLAGLDAFLDRADALGRRVFVVCNMRFHPAIQTLRRALGGVGRPRFVRAQYGNYLPDMRPGADYRTLYCAHKDQGGGVILDAIHEIDYLTWLFGPVVKVSCTAGRIGELDIDVEDYAAIVLEHQSGTRSEVHLDYLQRFKRRGCEIAGADGTLIWESEGKQPERCTVRRISPGASAWEPLLTLEGIDTAAQLAEVATQFAAGMSGRANDLLGGRDAAKVLQTALAAHQAAATGASVSLVKR